MENPFFDDPILNSPYDYPSRHWELDEAGQPTQQVIETRRGAEFITPIPKPRQRGRARGGRQQQLVFDEGQGLSTSEQQYDVTAAVNEIRRYVDRWREIPNPRDWGVTAETALAAPALAAPQVQPLPSFLLPGGGGGDVDLAHRGRASSRPG